MKTTHYISNSFSRSMFYPIRHDCKSPMFTFNILTVAVMAVILLTAGGCGITKEFNVQSNPEGALIMKHAEPNVDGASAIRYYGVTPGLKKMSLPKDRDEYLTLEKRGYKQVTQSVNKDSGATLSFDLERIKGVPDTVFSMDDLQSQTVTLLPPDVEVIIHSGVGQLDKKEYSPEKSKEAADGLAAALKDAFAGNLNIKGMPVPDETIRAGWEQLTKPLKTYLFQLNRVRLPYQSLPPYVNDHVTGFGDFTKQIKGGAGDDSRYLLYVWSKCVSETAGRKVGNILAAGLGALVAQVNTTYAGIHDASNFDLDTGTLVNLYFIDAKTSEVVYITQQVFKYDLTDPDHLKKVAAEIGGFPEAGKQGNT